MLSNVVTNDMIFIQSFRKVGVSLFIISMSEIEMGPMGRAVSNSVTGFHMNRKGDTQLTALVHFAL